MCSRLWCLYNSIEKETKENHKGIIKKKTISNDDIDKNKIKQDVNSWPESSDLKHHTWHNHKTQSLGNKMLKYKIEKKHYKQKIQNPK